MGHRNQTTVSDAELARVLCHRGPIVVAVGSRKGGVGKTSHASGMAIVAGALVFAQPFHRYSSTS